MKLCEFVIKSTENRRIKDAMAWVMKYLEILSDEYLLLGVFISAINLNKLISSPIHEQNQDIDEIDISLPRIKVLKNKSLKNLNIKKKRGIYLYKWGMSPLALLSLSF